MPSQFTLPGMTKEDGEKVAELLQGRLSALIDTQLTLKHIHWNVVGTNFIGVHEMLDPQHLAVSEMVDNTAERIAALGGEPMGVPGFISKNRTWDDYSINRGTTMQHLGALNLVYDGLISEHRKVMNELEELDPVSQDMIIDQLGQLENFHWFVRAHLETTEGVIVSEDEKTLKDAARVAESATSVNVKPGKGA